MKELRNYLTLTSPSKRKAMDIISNMSHRPQDISDLTLLKHQNPQLRSTSNSRPLIDIINPQPKTRATSVRMHRHTSKATQRTFIGAGSTINSRSKLC